MFPLPFLNPAWDIRKFLVCIMLKPGMQDFKHDLTSVGGESIVWWLAHSLVLPFLGIGIRIDLFQSRGSSRFADVMNATP